MDEAPLDFTQKEKRTAQVEAEIDGLRLSVRTLWESLQRVQRLLKIAHRVAIRRVGHGFGSGLVAVGYGLVPHLATQSVVRPPVDLPSQAVRI